MLPVGGSMLGITLNPHGEPGVMRPDQGFIIQLACSTMREITTLLSTVWEGGCLELRHMLVQSIRHPENLNALLFKREILFAL
jgi:hypothetical protein